MIYLESIAKRRNGLRLKYIDFYLEFNHRNEDTHSLFCFFPSSVFNSTFTWAIDTHKNSEWLKLPIVTGKSQTEISRKKREKNN